MKKLFCSLIVLSFILWLCVGMVSAEDCYGMDASCPAGFEVNCFQTDSYVSWNCVSDGSSLSYNMMPDGDSWCADDEVIDYNKDSCCPDEYPYLDNNLCYQSPSLDSKAKNYFTELFTCIPGTTKCDNKEQFMCVNTENRNSDNINIRESYYWHGLGKRIGTCDYYECYPSDTKCVGNNYYVCDNNKWSNQGNIKTKCDVDCLIDSDCNDDIFVVSYCEDKQNATNFLDYFCDDTTFSCDKKSNVKLDEIKLDVCGVECIIDDDCDLDFVNETCEGLDNVFTSTDNYCLDNICSSNITIDNKGHIENKCNVECFANIECIDYCDDKQPTCSDGICTCSYQIPADYTFDKFFLEYRYVAMFVGFLIVGICIIFRKTKKRGKKRRS